MIGENVSIYGILLILWWMVIVVVNLWKVRCFTHKSLLKKKIAQIFLGFKIYWSFIQFMKCSVHMVIEILIWHHHNCDNRSFDFLTCFNLYIYTYIYTCIFVFRWPLHTCTRYEGNFKNYLHLVSWLFNLVFELSLFHQGCLSCVEVLDACI